MGWRMQYTSYWEIQLEARALCFPRRPFRGAHVLGWSIGSVIRSINLSLSFFWLIDSLQGKLSLLLSPQGSSIHCDLNVNYSP